ncbi:DUF4442 domain-containing protein [Leptospira idonii]|uniref:DUF4442 domain-containing protein n=1 Tax=Leptospira idonii TaxID=1193500 RepID=A0A4R9M3M6_9LEPT|nr:DUF4442 domain-containing protein [Leptospira idonii]TGN20485.1 DUF4442 domain-containing protein [Leptospira idonii]
MYQSKVSWKTRLRVWLFNFYLPYLGAGIRITHIAPDFSRFRTEMKLTFYNRNYVGVHFGGSLYAMCDPFFMLILLERLGKDYIVWDKAGNMEFVKPGTGKVSAEFHITDAEIDRIKEEIEKKKKGDFTFHADVVGEGGEVIARVEKIVYVRKRGKLPVQN